jgi:hypothetical protein
MAAEGRCITTVNVNFRSDGRAVVAVLRGSDMTGKVFTNVSESSMRRLARECRYIPGRVYVYGRGWSWSRFDG